MFCHSCGTQVESGLQFCPSCGQALGEPGVPVEVTAYVPPAGIRAQSGHWIGEGWRIVKTDIWMFALAGLVFALLSSAIPLILQGPLTVGLHLYIIKRMMNRNAEFADLFEGFNFFIPALVASLIISLFVSIGTLLCLIPGLVVAAMYMFTYLFIFDKRMDFWPAMQASHAVVRNDYFGFTMFILLMSLVNLLGILCCIVGVFVTIPLCLAAVTVAYRDIVGFDPQTLSRL